MFLEPERRIFVYHDGHAEVRGDPLSLLRRLLFSTGGRYQSLIVTANSKPDGTKWSDLPESQVREICAASESLSNAVRSAFDLKDFDKATGFGCTDSDAFKVLVDFQTFLLQKKN